MTDVIAVETLGFRYPGAASKVLDGTSFSVARGEVYGLLGPSGSGKSTTQRILMGLLRGYSGSVELFGQPVQSLGRRLYDRIGVSFELPALYLRLTARENLAFFAALYRRARQDFDALLASVGLEDAADQRVEQFSKGMKMRLNLARALLNDPELLFLDEPTTGQDPTRARLTRELMRKLKGDGKTIFLTTHNMSEAEEVCDRIGFLSRGRVDVTGAPRELKQQFGQRRLEVTFTGKDGIERRDYAMLGIATNAEFQSLLASGNVTAMHTLEASLDDIFIKATTQDGPARDAGWTRFAAAVPLRDLRRLRGGGGSLRGGADFDRR